MPPATATSQPLCLLLALLLVRTGALKFSFSAFYPVTPNMTYQGDAFASGDGVIQLTKNELGRDLRKSWGRAVHLNPVHLWDSATGNLTSFSTRFSFYVGNPPGVNNPGDGLAFFLAPNGSSAPSNSAGGMLALFNVTPPSTATASIPTVAVEFDTYGNSWDPYAVHAGIDVNSVVSVVNVTWQGYGRWSNATVQASVDYDASATNMSVALSGDDGTYRTLHHIVDLREVLPEWVEVGFSATTGASVEIHKIESWSFQSTLEDVTPPSPPTLPPPPLLPPISPPPPPPPQGNERTNRLPVMVGALAGTGTLAVVAGILWFCVWRGRAGGGTEDVPVHERISQDEEMGADVDGIDDREFDGESRGPKRIPYSELARATRDFTDEGKLGEEGFGSVYKGFLRGPGLEVAVKKVSKSSKQGKKEFAAEIKIISRLRHRNLVQLVGWCHDRGDLLLVYEYMPNGSLDRHLYPRDGDGKPPPPPPPLTWEVRRRVSLGLASALFYLHEEWEQCVVHRDVKPSNVMLDAGFNARLGDFGLARLADHDRGLQTTVLAGTMGYIAPECITSGRASKESDVYSFGVLALEIACGRRAIESLAPPGEVGLVDWVWGLYGKGAILEAADKRLDADFNELEMERLMLVGLWCAHPDFAKRPSMRQVMSALNFEAPPPELAAAMPVPTYYEPPAPGKQTSFQVSSAMSAAGVPSSTSSSGGHTATSSSSLDSGKATGSSSATSIPLLPLKKN